jgi:hypothetical protein
MITLAFDPISCAVAMSALEHVCTKPRRAIHRARVWIRRTPSEVLLDVALNEFSDHVLGALNAVDARLVLIVAFLLFIRHGLQIAREAKASR